MAVGGVDESEIGRKFDRPWSRSRFLLILYILYFFILSRILEKNKKRKW
jgi:hypothetical protein